MERGLDTIKFAKPEVEEKTVLSKAESIRDEINTLNPEGLSLNKLSNDVLKQILAKYKKLERVVSGKEDSKELLERFETAKTRWMKLYDKYGIDASSLENLELTDEGLETQKEMAEKYGFDKILMIPAGVSPAELVNNKEFLIFTGSEEENQNSNPSNPIYINDKIKASEFWNKKLEKPQVIFLKNKNHVDDKSDETIAKMSADNPELFTDKEDPTTRDCTYPQIEKMESAEGIEGLDFVQAMILDREYFDDTGHHLFDWNDKNATWLTKTKDTAETGSCEDFGWSPGGRQWLVRLDDEACSLGYLGSVFARSLECKES